MSSVPEISCPTTIPVLETVQESPVKKDLDDERVLRMNVRCVVGFSIAVLGAFLVYIAAGTSSPSLPQKKTMSIKNASADNAKSVGAQAAPKNPGVGGFVLAAQSNSRLVFGGLMGGMLALVLTLGYCAYDSTEVVQPIIIEDVNRTLTDMVQNDTSLNQSTSSDADLEGDSTDNSGYIWLVVVLVIGVVCLGLCCYGKCSRPGSASQIVDPSNNNPSGSSNGVTDRSTELNTDQNVGQNSITEPPNVRLAPVPSTGTEEEKAPEIPDPSGTPDPGENAPEAPPPTVIHEIAQPAAQNSTETTAANKSTDITETSGSSTTSESSGQGDESERRDSIQTNSSGPTIQIGETPDPRLEDPRAVDTDSSQAHVTVTINVEQDTLTGQSPPLETSQNGSFVGNPPSDHVTPTFPEHEIPPPISTYPHIEALQTAEEPISMTKIDLADPRESNNETLQRQQTGPLNTVEPETTLSSGNPQLPPKTNLFRLLRNPPNPRYRASRNAFKNKNSCTDIITVPNSHIHQDERVVSKAQVLAQRASKKKYTLELAAVVILLAIACAHTLSTNTLLSPVLFITRRFFSSHRRNFFAL